MVVNLALFFKLLNVFWLCFVNCIYKLIDRQHPLRTRPALSWSCNQRDVAVKDLHRCLKLVLCLHLLSTQFRLFISFAERARPKNNCVCPFVAHPTWSMLISHKWPFVVARQIFRVRQHPLNNHSIKAQHPKSRQLLYHLTIWGVPSLVYFKFIVFFI